MMMQGIDVSWHNGIVDWDKVKQAGKEFAFIRMGCSGYEGGIWLYDDLCKRNVEGALKAGLKVGIYVYSYDKSPLAAAKTANEIIANLQGYDIQFPIALDIEETKDRVLIAQGKEGLSKTFDAFAKVIKASGYTPLLYTYTAFLAQYLNEPKDCDLWIADYRKPIAALNNPAGGLCPSPYEHTIWQYKGSNGRCVGVNGGCDLNISYVDYSRITETLDYKKLFEEEKVKRETAEQTLAQIKKLLS